MGVPLHSPAQPVRAWKVGAPLSRPYLVARHPSPSKMWGLSLTELSAERWGPWGSGHPLSQIRSRGQAHSVSKDTGQLTREARGYLWAQWQGPGEQDAGP